MCDKNEIEMTIDTEYCGSDLVMIRCSMKSDFIVENEMRKAILYDAGERGY